MLSSDDEIAEVPWLVGIAACGAGPAVGTCVVDK